MARDKGLEEILREDLEAQTGVGEQAMFGGVAFLLDGRLFCAARHDGLLIRLGKGRDGWALAIDGTGPMAMGARTMQGWVRAGPAAFGDDTLRRRLLDAALDFVRLLPPKEV